MTDTSRTKHNKSSCLLCESDETEFVFTSQRLYGPLVKCLKCGLYFVLRTETPREMPDGVESAGVIADMARLADRARELELIEPEVELREAPWRELTARERLDDLHRFVSSGRLLEVGCSTGELLEAASASFNVIGVDADPGNSNATNRRGIKCLNGSLKDAAFPDHHFDVAVLYHVIEHFHDPRAEMLELNRIIRPGGRLVLETPNIDNIWFRLLGARWRQFIPDHVLFFDPDTIKRLCSDTGFEVCELRNVGKSMSLRLFVDRVGRYNRTVSGLLMAIIESLKLADITLHLSFGDVMRLYARKV